MCGRVVMAIDTETLVRISRSRRLNNNQAYRPSHNIPPSRGVPTVYRNSQKKAEQDESNVDGKETINELEIMRFGMKNDDNYEVSNARSETLKSVSLFRGMIEKKNRCAIVVQGYYEWKELDPDGKRKQPYYIKHKDKEVLFFAGLYRDAPNLDGDIVKEFVIITRPSEGETSKIHTRMPVMLNEEDLEDWLSKDCDFDKIFKKITNNKLQVTCYPVGDLVNKLSNYGKDNLIHKDEIKYDKNKNLKINFLLVDVNKKLFDNKDKRSSLNSISPQKDECSQKHNQNKESNVEKKLIKGEINKEVSDAVGIIINRNDLENKSLDLVKDHRVDDNATQQDKLERTLIEKVLKPNSPLKEEVNYKRKSVAIQKQNRKSTKSGSHSKQNNYTKITSFLKK